jgi:LPS-assembly protein
MPASESRRCVSVLLALILAPATGVQAQSSDFLAADFLALCSVDPLAELLTVDTGADPQTSPTRFTADSGQVTPRQAELLGGVDVARGDLRLNAPRIDLDRVANRLTAEDVRYGSPTLAVRSERAELDLEAETATFEDAEYYLAERNAQGSASRIDVERQRRRSDLREVSYSTCARGAEFWQLRARELELDEPSGRGKARDITLAIGDVPLLYLPYLSFPIDDKRHSGWLVPRVGMDSASGLDLTTPYYWNIAPDRDMTFFPRLLSSRGLMLGAEYRFLTPSSRGLVSAEYLPDDREFDDDRGAFKIEYGANPRPGFYTDLLYQYVSDDDYLDDLDDATIGLLSPDYLERRLDLRYNSNHWTALARVQGFQTLDVDLFPPEDEPHERLPQLRVDGAWRDGWGGLDYTGHADLSNFDHDLKATGLRLDLGVGLLLPLEWPAGFIRPGVQYRFTGYELDETEPDADDGAPSDSITRSAPIASIDSGLFLERDGGLALAGQWHPDPGAAIVLSLCAVPRPG